MDLRWCLFVCLFCRLRYGPEGADRTFGRVFVLLGDVLQCAGHHGLEWYGEREIRRASARVVSVDATSLL